eukprot:Gb_16204 [translate_table: standard]
MYSTWQPILKIQKFRRIASYAGLYCLFSGLVYAYTNNSTRAGISRADQYYSSYPAGTELLSDTTKLYKTALGNVFEEEEWGPIEFSIMSKHFARQGKSPYAYHSVQVIGENEQMQQCFQTSYGHMLLDIVALIGQAPYFQEGNPSGKVHARLVYLSFKGPGCFYYHQKFLGSTLLLQLSPIFHSPTIMFNC